MTKSSSFCTTAAPAALRRRGARAVALAAMLLSAFVGISAARAGLPSPVVVADYGLREVGRGQLTWLGFRVYEASLWSGSGRWTGGGAEPVALSLWYQRRFSRDQLVDITTGEWERLGLAPPEARGRWTAELNRIWRDVRPGDNLTAVVVPGPAGETRFYDARGPIGRVGDPEAVARAVLIDDPDVGLVGGIDLDERPRGDVRPTGGVGAQDEPIDGDAGVVVVNPTPIVLEEYRFRQRQSEAVAEFPRDEA